MPYGSRLTTGVVISAMVLLTAACGGSSGGGNSGGSGEKSPPRVDFANLSEALPTFHAIKTNLDGVVKKGSPVDVKWYDNQLQPDTMLQNAQLMVQDHPDAMVMFPVAENTQGVSQILGDSKIPCVALNLDVKSCSFLNVDNAKLGADLAQSVGKVAVARGWNASNTTVLIGQAGFAGKQINDVIRYFYSAIGPELGMPKVDPESITNKTTRIGDNGIQFEGGGTLQGSFDAVNNLLPSIPKDRNIILFAINNDSLSGALRAVEEAGRGDNLLMAGVGGDEIGVKALRNDPRWVAEGAIFIGWWGAYAVAMAEALSEGVKPPADVTPLPQVVLDKSTVDQYYAAGSAQVVKLPDLVDNNRFLGKTHFFQYAMKTAGL
jgi:ribose transport system substrate-binding protein